MGIKADEISKELNNVWVDDAISIRTVKAVIDQNPYATC